MRRLEPHREWKEPVGRLEFPVRGLPLRGPVPCRSLADPSAGSGSSGESRSSSFHRRIQAVTFCARPKPAREHGEVGALLRREGLYSSHLTTWRRQREAGILSGLKPKQRGRKANPIHPLQAENDQLRKENSRLQKRLKRAELIIDIQKKISQMLGIPLENPEIGEDD